MTFTTCNEEHIDFRADKLIKSIDEFEFNHETPQTQLDLGEPVKNTKKPTQVCEYKIINLKDNASRNRNKRRNN